MAIFDNLGGGEDITAIVDAVESMGVDVPDGATSDDVAALISENLYRVLETSTASMSRTTTGEFNLTATPEIIPYGTASISGNAIQYSNNGILVKVPIKTAKIGVRASAVNTMSTAWYTVTQEIRVNGSVVGSSAFQVEGKTQTQGSAEFTLENLKEGDIITHYIYRGSLSSGYSVYKEAHMNCTFIK